MGLRQKVKLELDDGTEVVAEYSAVDLRAWERENHRSALNEPMSIGMLSWLGWSAAKRQGSINGAYDTFAKFDAACVDVSGVDEEEGPEQSPTEPAETAGTPKGPGPDSSALSRSE